MSHVIRPVESIGRGLRFLRSPEASSRARTIGLLVAGVAFVAGIAATPPPGNSAADGFAGLPRLVLYALAALALAVTGPTCASDSLKDYRQPAGKAEPVRTGGPMGRPSSGWISAGLSEPGWRVAAVVLALASGLAVWNRFLLQRSLNDPLGPPLWIASMLLLGLLALPSVRRLGWSPRWSPREPAGERNGLASRPDRRRIIAWVTLFLLLVLAAALRFVVLGDVPNGLHSDEGDRANIALRVLDGTAPASWFDSGWYYINMIYFRVLAWDMAIFGATIGGARVLSAAMGTALVAVVALMGCRHFGWRLGLLATGFAVSGAINLQASRFIAETGVMMLLWGISIFALLEGGRSGRPWAFALAGAAGGLSLYFYPAARLWPVGAGLSLIVLWVYERREQREGLVRGALIAALTSLIVVSPFLVNLQRHPNETTLRYEQTTALSPTNQVRMRWVSPGIPLPDLLILQTERTVGMFDRYPDENSFLSDRRPVFPQPLAGLAIVGAAYTLLRARRDARLMVLSIWFWLGLSGVLLTVETPSYLRALGILPVLPFILGLVVVDVVDRVSGVVRPGGQTMRTGWRLPTLAAANLVLGLAVLAVVATESYYYFKTYSPPVQAWGPITREGLQIAELSKGGPVYSLESSEHMVDSGWVRFLAQGTARGRVANPGQQLPLLAATEDDLRPAKRDASGPPPIPASGSGLTFLLYPDPNQASYASLLQALYPGGTFLDPIDERTPYRVSADALSRSRGVNFATGSADSAVVGSFGEAPRGVVSPSGVWWRGGIRLPQSGRFGFRLTASCPASLFVDDVSVLAIDGKAGAVATRERLIEAARGLHFVKVGGESCSLTDTLTLERAGPLSPTGPARYRQFSPEEIYRLMDAPWGLLGRVVSDRDGVRSSSPDASNLFLDSTVAGAFLSQYMPIKGPPIGVEWAGSLVVTRAGTYRMAFASEGDVSMRIDDRPIAVRAVKPEEWRTVGQGTPVELAAGAHPVRIGFQSASGGRSVIRWNWVPPTDDGRLNERGGWSVVPPMALRPEAPIKLVETPRSP